MAMPSHLLSTAFSLTAVFAWGTSDFLGGYAARRSNAFLLTTLAHASGLLLMTVLALLAHPALPSPRSTEWALAAGFSGGTALAIFYRALASGSMGLTAPVAAVLGAAIPTVFTIITEGIPGLVPLAGFLLAGMGILLISRAEDSTIGNGVGLAVLAGIGFAGFYLCVKQAGDSSALWVAVASRAAALAVTGTAVLLAGKNWWQITKSGVKLGALAGCLDVSGTFLFIRASQMGRLDAAVVLTSLYPAVTVLLARMILKEHFTRWKAVGLIAALLAVPMIAGQ